MKPRRRLPPRTGRNKTLPSWNKKTPRSDLPYLTGEGPPTFSTSVALARIGFHIFDVNGYYAALGVDVRATRKQIKDAYIARAGNTDAYLTYVVKQLLNPDVRAKYDATPLGSVFVDDYVKRSMRSRLVGRKRSLETLDADPVTEQYGGTENDLGESVSHPLVTLPDWRFSHYLWGSAETDETKLREWQGALIIALGGKRIEIAIGLMGGFDRPWAVETVGYRTVVFLNDQEQPTPANAQAAAFRIKESFRPFG